MAKISRFGGPSHDPLAAYPRPEGSDDSRAVSDAVDATGAPEDVAKEETPGDGTPVPAPPKGKKVSGKAAVALPGLKVGNTDG